MSLSLSFSLSLLLLLVSGDSLDSTPVFGFWHIGVLGTYMDVVTDQLSQLQKATFSTSFTFVRILSNKQSRNDVEWLIRTHPAAQKLGNIVFTYATEAEGQHFMDTKTSWLVRKLSDLIMDDGIVWFIHNKGVTRFGHEYAFVTDWRRMMMYFLFEKDWCYQAIQGGFYDTCGSNFQFNPFRHYSGTFWMSHFSYIRTLPYAKKFWVDEYRQPDFMAGEFWLLNSNLNASRILCVHSSSVNNYESAYPRSVYESARIGEGCELKVRDDYLAYLGGGE